MWPVSTDPVDFDEAIAWFRKRVKLTPEQWAKLSERARRKAFTVSGAAQLDLVNHAWKGIDQALAKGTTLKDFKRDFGDKLKAAWGGDEKNPAWRLESVYRTNVQLAYSAGRYRQAKHPDVLEVHPIWMFDAILDGRETSICRECDATKLPADDEWWDDHQPPLHPNCRSSVITMADDGEISERPAVSAVSGFGRAPADDEDEDLEPDWEPDLTKYPDELQAAYLDKLEGQEGEP